MFGEHSFVSRKAPLRYGDDMIFEINHQPSESCSEDFSVSGYDELLPKNRMEDLSFTLYGSIESASNSCEQVECPAGKVWNWFDCECICPGDHTCSGHFTYNNDICACDC